MFCFFVILEQKTHRMSTRKQSRSKQRKRKKAVDVGSANQPKTKRRKMGRKQGVSSRTNVIASDGGVDAVNSLCHSLSDSLSLSFNVSFTVSVIIEQRTRSE